jgi:hypothetical protein
MRSTRIDLHGGERGSALVLALLVSVILSLLGTSYLLMAETENRIAENELRAAQSLYVGESGARLVKRWFDRPGSAANVVNPPLAVIDRSRRLIDADGDPATDPLVADGSAGKPYYKQGMDRNGDSVDDVFDKPYRPGLADTLMGTEAGPDMRIDEEASPEARQFLVDLTAALLPAYPAWGAGVRARIARIDVYAPPYIQSFGVWTRYGMGTIKVTARIYKESPDGAEQVLAERIIKVVLNETPFPGPFGPLHSCDELRINGDFNVHWGVATAMTISDLTNNHKKIPVSIPRVVPAGLRLDALFGFDNDTWFANYRNVAEGIEIEDPWFRYMSRGPVLDAPNGNVQPHAFPVSWDPDAGGALGDEEIPYHDASIDGSHSNIFQNLELVTCPEFDYGLWKSIATSGGSDVHFYVWNDGTAFKENGFGAARSFREITDDREGLFFFDTKDGRAPHDDDSDSEFDNLTPEIALQGGTYGVRGFVYLNSESFKTRGLTGRPVTFNAPGEPFQDRDQDGVFEPSSGESWINLNYPTSLPGAFTCDALDTLQDDGTMGTPGTQMRNDHGPDILGEAAVWGVLYTNGYWDSTGNAVYYGSVISKSGIGETSPSAGTPDLYWDENIVKNWPPDGWDLPRVIITRWETDL